MGSVGTKAVAESSSRVTLRVGIGGAAIDPVGERLS
jgi:hypothetical protein